MTSYCRPRMLAEHVLAAALGIRQVVLKISYKPTCRPDGLPVRFRRQPDCPRRADWRSSPPGRISAHLVEDGPLHRTAAALPRSNQTTCCPPAEGTLGQALGRGCGMGTWTATQAQNLGGPPPRPDPDSGWLQVMAGASAGLDSRHGDQGVHQAAAAAAGVCPLSQQLHPMPRTLLSSFETQDVILAAIAAPFRGLSMGPFW